MIRPTVKNGEIVIDEKSLGLKSLRDLYFSGSKVQGNHLLYFVYLMEDLRPSNPMRDLPNSEKEDECRLECFGKRNFFHKPEIEKLIDLALTTYEKHNQTAEERMLLEFDRQIDELTVLLSGLKGMSGSRDSSGDYSIEGNLLNSIKKSMHMHDVDIKIQDNIIEAINTFEGMRPTLNGDYAKTLDGLMDNIKKLEENKKIIKNVILEGGSGKLRGDKKSSLLESGINSRVESKFHNA